MNIRRNLLTVSAAIAIVAGAGILWAQPDDKGDDKDADATLPMEKKVTLTPKQMRVNSEKLIDDMKGMLERVIAVQQVARKQKDVIRLNCVNDRLLQVKKLLNIAEASRNDLIEAIAADNERERYHQYSKVTISHEKVSVLRDEAEACIGEELIFIGPTQVEVDKPDIPDDPTRNDPFILTDDTVANDGIERPAFASPYL